MSKNLCPSCASRNTTVGIAPDSTNVSLLCNTCNFRDVVYYGDSRQDAYRYWQLCHPPRAMRDRATRFRVRRFVPAMRAFQNPRYRQKGRLLGVLLPHLSLRVECPKVKGGWFQRLFVVLAAG